MHPPAGFPLAAEFCLFVGVAGGKDLQALNFASLFPGQRAI